MEADFVRAKEQLVSENMVLAKKLDALEEFRVVATGNSIGFVWFSGFRFLGHFLGKF